MPNYITTKYTYSTTASYTAYLKSWGGYYSGRPLGNYQGATLLPKMPGTEVLTAFGRPVGRLQITTAQIAQVRKEMAKGKTTVNPQQIMKVPDALPADIETPKAKRSESRPVAAAPALQAVVDESKAKADVPVAAKATGGAVKRKRCAAEDDGAEMAQTDEELARKLQFELNYGGSRKRARQL